MNKALSFIENKLNERRSAGTYRTLKLPGELVDFCSNDYLGFARSAKLKDEIDKYLVQSPGYLNGSTGSRLISGNTEFCEELETYIASYHHAESGLIFNSGYDANLGLFSSLPQRADTIITDELIHASIIDGCRLSYASRYIFRHNDLNSLEDKIKQAKGTIYIAVESVYSMDGDIAPLHDLAAIAEQYNAHLIVDEAHALGVFGKGLVNHLNLEAKIFARVITFGKALGVHGAIVLGSNLLTKYLINFARPFIYTTASSFHQLASIKMAYHLLDNSLPEQLSLNSNITLFNSNLSFKNVVQSSSAIQSVIIGGNEATARMGLTLQNEGLNVKPILSPTVKEGTERLRVCLHSYNHPDDILRLIHLLNQNLND